MESERLWKSKVSSNPFAVLQFVRQEKCCSERWRTVWILRPRTTGVPGADRPPERPPGRMVEQIGGLVPHQMVEKVAKAIPEESKDVRHEGISKRS